MLLYCCIRFVVYFCTEDQQRKPGTEALFHTVVLRLGALLVLVLTVGNWSDVLHVLITFLGEAVSLLPSQDLLRASLQVCVNQLFTQRFYIFDVPFLDCDVSSITISLLKNCCATCK